MSGDLTRGLDRFTLPLMGRVQSVDAAWDLTAMSNVSTVTSLAESPVEEGVLRAGTDDGLIRRAVDPGPGGPGRHVGARAGRFFAYGRSGIWPPS